MFLKLLQLQLNHIFSLSTLKIGEVSNKDGGRKSGPTRVVFILLIESYLGGSVECKLCNNKVDGLAFERLSPHLPLLPLLACVQLSGGYKYTWLSGSFQLSHSQPSAPETHYCSFWLILKRNTCPGLCLALTGRDQMIKYDLSGTVQELHIPIGMWTKAMSARGTARCVS